MNSVQTKKSGLEEAVADYLVRHKKRNTRERAAIVGAIDALTTRFTVDKIHSIVDTGSFHISLATVYNTIDMLVDAGLLRRREDPAGTSATFEKASAAMSPRLQLVCETCGSVKIIKDPELVKMLDRRRFQDFSPTHYDLRILGTCQRCLRRRRRQAERGSKANKKY